MEHLIELIHDSLVDFGWDNYSLHDPAIATADGVTEWAWDLAREIARDLEGHIICE